MIEKIASNYVCLNWWYTCLFQLFTLFCWSAVLKGIRWGKYNVWKWWLCMLFLFMGLYQVLILKLICYTARCSLTDFERGCARPFCQTGVRKFMNKRRCNMTSRKGNINMDALCVFVLFDIKVSIMSDCKNIPLCFHPGANQWST